MTKVGSGISFASLFLLKDLKIKSSSLERDSLVSQMVKNLPAMQETWVQSLGQEIPWRRKWQPTPVFVPGKSHRQRSLAVHGVAKSQTRLSDFTFTFLF